AFPSKVFGIEGWRLGMEMRYSQSPISRRCAESALGTLDGCGHPIADWAWRFSMGSIGKESGHIFWSAAATLPALGNQAAPLHRHLIPGARHPLHEPGEAAIADDREPQPAVEPQC